uniref:Sulfotransferase domain-containing protein n=1 Tax=Candidatus Kentrum sp. DK TaxID=2126562 RepID=A0A450T6B7_9GAMM|nr:MAG: hypothetical protein BECKDK2373C_GA0170839_109512 [Candidatus Kentron sp. DK]
MSNERTASRSSLPIPLSSGNGHAERTLTLENENRDPPVSRPPSPDHSSHNNLLERARTQWQFGDWGSLAKLDRDTLEHHPDRAKLALLAAAGLAQMDELSAAREFVQLALDWGCEKRLISRVLISGVYNSLGRSAAITGQQIKTLKHFESAIAITMPKSKTMLITEARMARQVLQLGVLSNRNEEVAPELTKRSAPEPTTTSPTGKKTASSTFGSEAYVYYQELSHRYCKETDQPFILLDCKSLPRSGLHYMKNTFTKILDELFSFCEWYVEPGCCKTMPCSIIGYAEQCKNKNTPRFRLTKSHDFGLTDPEYLPVFSARRVILLRDPLFLLTSWYALNQLENYKPVLQKNGIEMKKIFFLHEPDVIAAAYRAMDRVFIHPSKGSLDKWLGEKIAYISGFLNKWVKPSLERPQPYVQVVRYEEIDSYVLSLLNELRGNLPERIEQKIVDEFDCEAGSFLPRQDPFSSQSKRLSDYMKDSSQAFAYAASKIVACAPDKVFD